MKAGLRTGIYLAVLIAVVAWALTVQRGRQVRRKWDRPLDVAVVLVSTEAAPAALGAQMQEALTGLETQLTAEHGRYQRDGLQPFHFHAFGPVQVVALPPLPPESNSFGDRARYMADFYPFARDVKKRAGVEGKLDVTLYALLSSAPNAQGRFTEGAGARGGDFGLVRTPLREATSVLSLTALAHELLHCVGATDKYDEQGHSRVPEGLADPELEPPMPQTDAEVMVGEVALAPETGKVPERIEQVRVGPYTAAEIRWTMVKP